MGGVGDGGGRGGKGLGVTQHSVHIKKIVRFVHQNRALKCEIRVDTHVH